MTTYPVQRYDFSYGTTTPGGSTLRYFSPPTPGASNSTATSWSGVTVNYQIDGDYKQTNYSTWVDKMTLNYW